MPQQKDIFDLSPAIVDMKQDQPQSPYPESDMGVMAGMKRGLLNLNPANIVAPTPPTTNPQEIDRQQEAFKAGLQHFTEHPIASALGQIPFIGSLLQSLAERLPHDPSGAAAEGLITSGIPALLGGAPEIPGLLRSTATKAGIPQLMSEVAEAPVYRATGAGPVIKAAARRLYEPPMPTPPQTINAEFVNTPEAPIDVTHVPRLRTALPPAPEAPAPMVAHQVGAGKATPEISGKAPTRTPLNPAPGAGVPRGTEGTPLPADPALPAHYANVPAESPVAPPGTMGKLRTGEEGGIPQRGEQTVTGTQVPMGRHPAGTVIEGEKVGGRIRPMTEAEIQKFVEQRTTSGRTARETPQPTPPPKPKAAKGGK